MACNVSMYGRTKVASLRTAIYLSNETDDYIQLATRRECVEELNGDGLSALVHPGAGISVLPGTEIVWIRPSAHYDWAEVFVPMLKRQSIATGEASINRPTRSSAVGGGAQHSNQQVEAVCRASGKFDNEDVVCYAVGTVFNGNAMTLRLTPTVAIHNRLPYAMKLRVYRYEDSEAIKTKTLRADCSALIW